MKDLKAKVKYDLFSKEISLYFRGSGYYSTLFGKIATVSYISLYIMLLVYYSLFGILKKKGTFTSTEKITKELPNITLSKNNLYFAFSLEDPYTYDSLGENGIYYSEAYYKNVKRVGDNWIWEQKKLEIVPCELDFFGEKYQDLLKLKPYKTYSCIKNLNGDLFGHFVYDEYSFIYLQIFPCVNDTKHNCKPQNIIDKYLNGTFINIEMQNILLNVGNYKEPVKEQFEDAYTTIGRGFKRELHIYFKIVNFEDYGFFGESLGERKYLQYDYNQAMFTLNNDFEKNKSICDVTIKLYDKTLIIKREYNTLIDIFSKLGGIMELLLKIITFISFFPVTTLFDISVINELFQFDEKNKETLYKGIKNKNFFRAGTVEYHTNEKNLNTKSEFKRLKSVYERKSIINDQQKNSKLKLSIIQKKKNMRQSLINNFNSKDFILNNIISNICKVGKNNNIVNNNSMNSNNLNKNFNIKKKDNIENNQSIDEPKIIKIIKMNPFNICLFSVFPNKFTNKNSSLLNIGLCKFREELDVAKLFRIGLLNNRAIEILKKNCSLLSFDKEDLVINTDALYTEDEKDN